MKNNQTVREPLYRILGEATKPKPAGFPKFGDPDFDSVVASNAGVRIAPKIDGTDVEELTHEAVKYLLGYFKIGALNEGLTLTGENHFVEWHAEEVVAGENFYRERPNRVCFEIRGRTIVRK